jgi:L-aminopeptidase/D-esterase-like protein
MLRARELGIPFDGIPGALNTITDVTGTDVGHTTLIAGRGRLRVGKGPVRTGVTAILPRGRSNDPVFAGWYSLNGNGEMTGTTWVEESGILKGPVMITNTHSVGVVHDAVLGWEFQQDFHDPRQSNAGWSLPVVAETYDGFLNDINGFHVKPEHVFAALDEATTGSVTEGNVGGGTGMICHGFKGGIGTASRLVTCGDDQYTVGALVQANYGSRRNLTIAGVPVGREIIDMLPSAGNSRPKADGGSIIVVVATDAPLLPHQLKRLARRIPLGIARVGGYGANSSGDIFIAYSTANPGLSGSLPVQQVDILSNDLMTPLFETAAWSTEEAIINAIVAAETMEGIDGNIVYALPHDRLVAILQKYGRFAD